MLGLEVDACLGGAREDDGLPVDDGEEGEARRDAQARTGVATQLSHPLRRWSSTALYTGDYSAVRYSAVSRNANAGLWALAPSLCRTL